MLSCPVTSSRRRASALRRAAVLQAVLLAAGAAQAATWTVTSVGDNATTAPCSVGNQCATLRDAIAAAAAAGDTIQFSGTGIIPLVAELVVSKNLTIHGPGAAQLTLSGQGAVRILTVSAGSLTLSGVTLADGSAQRNHPNDWGGAVYVSQGATLSLADSVVRNNTAGFGGGLAASNGTLAVTDTTFENNSASFYGGAAFVWGVASNGSFVANTFSGNAADSSGGAINANNDSVLTAVNNTFEDNRAELPGGAVFVVGAASIRNNTFSANRASGGAAIFAVSLAGIDNNVFTDNVSTFLGGALWGSIAGSRNVFFNNTIAGMADDATTYGTTSPIITTAAPLGALGNHGGLTQTMLPQGAALCAGDVSLLPAGTTTDQRGQPRTSAVPAGTCLDAGAVQLVRTAATVVVAVTGNGSVSAGATPAPLAGGISACTSQGGAACQADYDSNLVPNVTLTATPPAGEVVSWGGACAGATGNSCIVTMDQARAVTAAFAAAPALPVGLIVAVTGNGSVSAGATPAPLAGGINACASQGGAACQADYDSNLVPNVTLTATPPAGEIVSWGGACAGATGNSCTVTMDQARAVAAVFAAAPPVPVPTLGQWGLLLLGALAAAIGGLALRRRSA
ncbi:IPTL-CTERM sorting domain-containing protein [Ottowia flava]|uniref:IPTL-CTERM sorting domain-containing protein n=1 Tax=Ottowia flava TaxID=2675430 RepID=A0ABW4KVT8_9BURK|nr:IPTL-CTERM sorting domain-containing protein [Ottowia sp. GY511]